MNILKTMYFYCQDHRNLGTPKVYYMPTDFEIRQDSSKFYNL